MYLNLMLLKFYTCIPRHLVIIFYGLASKGTLKLSDGFGALKLWQLTISMLEYLYSEFSRSNSVRILIPQ